MRELNEADFETLKRSPSIRAGLAGIESRRAAAKRRFWIVLPAGAALLAAQFWFFWQRDLVPVGSIILAIGGLVVAVQRPTRKAGSVVALVVSALLTAWLRSS